MSQILTKSEEFQNGLQLVSDIVGVPPERILEKTRIRDVVIARHLLRYYLRNKCLHTYPLIAKFTKCNHATAIHSVRYIEDCAEYDKLYSLYKHSIDTGVLKTNAIVRDEVTKILKASRSIEFKCNEIITLYNERIRNKSEEQGVL